MKTMLPGRFRLPGQQLSCGRLALSTWWYKDIVLPNDLQEIEVLKRADKFKHSCRGIEGSA